jgi:hypothetical protein
MCGYAPITARFRHSRRLVPEPTRFDGSGALGAFGLAGSGARPRAYPGRLRRLHPATVRGAVRRPAHLPGPSSKPLVARRIGFRSVARRLSASVWISASRAVSRRDARVRGRCRRARQCAPRSGRELEALADRYQRVAVQIEAHVAGKQISDRPVSLAHSDARRSARASSASRTSSATSPRSPRPPRTPAAMPAAMCCPPPPRRQREREHAAARHRHGAVSACRSNRAR